MAPAQELPASLKESLDKTKVEYRTLGKSGLRISVPIFGTMSLGDRKVLPWVVEEEEVSPHFRFHHFGSMCPYISHEINIDRGSINNSTSDER